MPIKRMNHAVLFVRDAERTAVFYRDVLGFRDVFGMDGARFLQAPASTNDHDIAFFSLGPNAGDSEAGRTTVGLYHVAWEVETLADLGGYRDKLRAAGALTGMSDHGTTKSLYARDPDGLEFEIAWVVPAGLLAPEDLAARESGVRPLDLEREIARFGPGTRGG